MKKNILAVQMSSHEGDFEANSAKISSLIGEFYSGFEKCPNISNPAAANSGYGANKLCNSGYPDIIFLPEVWTLGWYPSIFKKYAKANEKALEFLSALAKKYDVNIIGGSYIRETKDGYKNSCPVVSRNGEILAFYDKIHLYSPDGEAEAVNAGNTPVIVDIEGLKTGLSICYDIRFPELFRSYITSPDMPDMLVNLSAWPKTRKNQYEAMAKSRAVENQSYFLALTQTGPLKDNVYNCGYSMLVNPLGDTIVSLNDDEGFIFETVDTDVTTNVRRQYPNLSNRKVNNFGFQPEFIKIDTPLKAGV